MGISWYLNVNIILNSWGTAGITNPYLGFVKFLYWEENLSLRLFFLYYCGLSNLQFRVHLLQDLLNWNLFKKPPPCGLDRIVLPKLCKLRFVATLCNNQISV